jgi:hypothetical protein
MERTGHLAQDDAAEVKQIGAMQESQNSRFSL